MRPSQHFINAVAGGSSATDISAHTAYLSSYWPLEGANAGDGLWHDTRGSNHLTPTTPLSIVTGKHVQAVQISASPNGKLEKTSPTNILPSTNIVMALWAKCDLSVITYVYDAQVVEIGIKPDGTAYITAILGGTYWTEYTGAISGGTSGWHHYCGIVIAGATPAETTSRLYVDGSLAANDTTAYGAFKTTTPSYITMCDNDKGGTLDEVAVFIDDSLVTSTSACDSLASLLYNSGTGKFWNGTAWV